MTLWNFRNRWWSNERLGRWSKTRGLRPFSLRAQDLCLLAVPATFAEPYTQEAVAGAGDESVRGLRRGVARARRRARGAAAGAAQRAPAGRTARRRQGLRARPGHKTHPAADT